MSDKNKLTVRIAGNDYTLCGVESEEYMQKVALYVDRKTMEVTRHNRMLSTSMSAVLTAINIADEMLKLVEINKEQEHEVGEMKRKLHRQVDENTRLIAENKNMQNNLTQLRLDLARREAEIKEVRNTLETLTRKQGLRTDEEDSF